MADYKAEAEVVLTRWECTEIMHSMRLRITTINSYDWRQAERISAIVECRNIQDKMVEAFPHLDCWRD